MSKIILIGINNKFSAKVNKWLFSSTGLLFLLGGGFNIYANNLEPFGLILGALMMIGGLYYVTYGLVGFSKNSKFATKVKVDESTIELKNSLWKPVTRLNWSDLSSIEFQSYEVIFKLKDSSNSFSYNSNADVSRAIKQIIRECAEQRNIEVIEG